MPTKEELKELQSKSLEEKIQISTARIIEWYENWEGAVYISNSGGVDSTVLSDLVHRVYPDVPDVFVDTGLEYPELREFIKSKPNVITLHPTMNFVEIIKKYGYPLISKEVSRDVHCAKSCPNGKTAKKFEENSEYCQKYGTRYCLAKYKNLVNAPFRLSNQCCNIMKKDTVKHFEKRTGQHGFVGSMTEESNRREKTWLKQGCNAFTNKQPISTPLSFWTKSDILEYLVKYNIPYASVYGEIVQDGKGKYKTTGTDRTGCVFCGFGVTPAKSKKLNKFQKLAITHPKLYDYCMKGGTFVDGLWQPDKGLGMAKVLDYINVKWWNDGDEDKRDEYRRIYRKKEEAEAQRKLTESETNE